MAKLCDKCFQRKDNVQVYIEDLFGQWSVEVVVCKGCWYEVVGVINFVQKYAKVQIKLEAISETAPGNDETAVEKANSRDGELPDNDGRRPRRAQTGVHGANSKAKIQPET